MAGFDHAPSDHEEPADPATARRNARLGLILFFLYTACYFGYVGLNTFRPDAMGMPLFGINLAVISGFALIVGAFLLALVYGWMCRFPVTSQDRNGGAK